VIVQNGGHLGLEQVLIEAGDVVENSQRHGLIARGLEFDQQVEKQPLADALPVHLHRPDDVLEALLDIVV
jgi:hypothetical protein